jgi:hypothetical protein
VCIEEVKVVGEQGVQVVEGERREREEGEKEKGKGRRWNEQRKSIGGEKEKWGNTGLRHLVLG